MKFSFALLLSTIPQVAQPRYRPSTTLKFNRTSWNKKRLVTLRTKFTGSYRLSQATFTVRPKNSLIPFQSILTLHNKTQPTLFNYSWSVFLATSKLSSKQTTLLLSTLSLYSFYPTLLTLVNLKSLSVVNLRGLLQHKPSSPNTRCLKITSPFVPLLGHIHLI